MEIDGPPERPRSQIRRLLRSCAHRAGIEVTMGETPGWERLTPDKKEALEVIQHKIARILNGNPEFHDSWHDIVGYARLAADRVKKPA
jgi:hypothetical protein